MKRKVKKKLTKQELYLSDHSDETEFIINNTPNYNGVSEIIKGPISILENNCLVDLFSPQFDATPNEITPCDLKLIHQIAGGIMQDLEALIKAYARHGKSTLVHGETNIEKRDKRDGKIKESFPISCLEQLVQAATIGTWLEIQTAIRHQGEKYQLHIFRQLFDRHEFETIEDMYKFVEDSRGMEDIIVEFKELLEDKTYFMEIFPKPADLATAIIDHQEGEKDFIDSIKESAYIQKLEEVDKNILLQKIEDELGDMLKKLARIKI
tara:strand:+ start:5543 stop:6340 length:798 start_codon:yes stop_codon:yes gene_type:complete